MTEVICRVESVESPGQTPRTNARCDEFGIARIVKRPAEHLLSLSHDEGSYSARKMPPECDPSVHSPLGRWCDASGPWRTNPMFDGCPLAAESLLRMPDRTS